MLVLLCLPLFLSFAADAQAQSCSASDTAVTAVTGGASDTTLAMECATLLDLLPTLRGTGEALNWANSLSMADWEGITLSGSRVTKVEVSRKMFNGTISSSIATLTELTNLLLEANEITGSIPDLSALTKLEWLQLNDNKLTGTINVNHIPASLVSLSLAANELSGPFPDLSKFTSLEIIGLHLNDLTGNVNTLGNTNLSNVYNISISSNRLSGEVPDLSHMTGLQSINIAGNDFTGNFPALDSDAPLATVYAHRNRLSGSIPDFSSYERLETLALSDNEFSGTINASHLPEEKLRDLYLHRNKLTGSLSSMNAFTKLRYFYVHGNQLTGALPTTWDALTSLQQLHLSFNDFTGAIPSGLDDLDALVNLSLCSTNLDSSATLPTDLETRRTAGTLTLFKCIWVDDAEAEEGSAIQFTVDYNIFPLKGSSSVQLSYETEDITATDGSDYTGTSLGSLTIPAIGTNDSSSSATFSVPTTADSVAEPDETFIVRLGDLPDGVAGRGSAVGKIQGTTPGITLSPPGPLRLLETGTTSYTVVLDAAPTHDVTVTVTKSQAGLTGTGRTPDQNAADPSSNQLTFTTTNWSQPQTVTVTGADESGRHRNRAMRLIHSAGSTDSRYAGFNTNLRVDVDDAPEITVWWDFKGRVGPHPAPINLAGEGNPEATQNAAPFTRMNYAVRLSNPPAPGGTVTVTATVPEDKRHILGLSLTKYGALRDSLTVDFKDREPGAGTGCSNWIGLRKNEYFDSGGNIRTVTGGGNSETWDNSADTPWKCWRRIYVVRKPGSHDIANTCVDITHTATGGGVRRVAIDTVRALIINSYPGGSGCGRLVGNTLSQNSPAQVAPAPTEKISNLQVTAVDATSVSVTWDAVEHATSYDVSWSAESSDSLAASAGAESVTGTTATIQHDALVPMTLTVTVTPEYIDENGVTQQLDALARTATLAVGPLGQRLSSGGGTNGGDGGSIDAGFGAVDLPVPVSHWRFEDDAVDWVGSSHGTEKGGVAFEANKEGEGVESYALSLDGTDDYVDLSSHVSDFPLGDSTRSVTGWFKADTGNQRQTFFTYGPNVEGKRFSIAADRTQVLVAVSGHAWGVNGLELEDGWHHIAVTYAGGDSDDILIYLDGELQTASTLAGSSKRLDTQTGPAAIGRSVSGTKHYTGLIDDVRLYDVALSAEHVLALFEEHSQTVLAEDNPEVCVSDELVADVEGYSKETWRESADHMQRWLRVLETFSGTASDSRVMTPTEAEGYLNRGWQRWEPVLEALECMEENQ